MVFIIRLMFGGAALLAALVLYFIVQRLGLYTPYGVTAAIGLPLAALVIFACVAIRMRANAVWLVAIELGAFVATLLAVETLIAAFDPTLQSTQLLRARVAHKLGLEFDVRTKSDVVAELRDQGVDALPSISREWPRLPRVRQQLPDGLFPLSHASKATIVECNESGKYLLLHTDEFGFNNPPGLIASRNVDIAAVGASFTLGHCVPPEASLIGTLRHTYPRIANFGMAGSASLSMLATFREYVEPLEPPVVLWIMHPWTADVTDESKDPILPRYLDSSFSQQLFARPADVDRVWREIAIPTQHEFDRRNTQINADNAANRFKRVVKLPEIRARFTPDAGWRRPPPDPDLGQFTAALHLAHSTTERWGGKFIVLIMPLYAEVVVHQMQPTLRHDNLARVLAADGITVIDVAGFAQAQRDPASLYTMRISNHPNPEGYALLTGFIEQELRKQLPAGIPRPARQGASGDE